MELLTKFTSRRFLLTLLCFITFSALLVFGHLTDVVYAGLVSAVVIPYLGVNTYQKVQHDKNVGKGAGYD